MIDHQEDPNTGRSVNLRELSDELIVALAGRYPLPALYPVRSFVPGVPGGGLPRSVTRKRQPSAGRSNSLCRQRGEIDGAFASLAQRHADALLVSANPLVRRSWRPNRDARRAPCDAGSLFRTPDCDRRRSNELRTELSGAGSATAED
jgi:hypothetical protein